MHHGIARGHPVRRVGRFERSAIRDAIAAHSQADLLALLHAALGECAHVDVFAVRSQREQDRQPRGVLGQEQVRRQARSVRHDHSDIALYVNLARQREDFDRVVGARSLVTPTTPNTSRATREAASPEVPLRPSPRRGCVKPAIAGESGDFGGGNDALVPLRDVLLRWRFPRERVPHFVNGISGHPFQSPFASPPGEGLSSADGERALGVLQPRRWIRAGLPRRDLRAPQDQACAHLGAGALLMAVMCSRAFGRFYGGL